jgi:hypothetical protein
MGEIGRINTGFWWESQKERDNEEHLDICGRVILKWILEKYDGAV